MINELFHSMINDKLFGLILSLFAFIISTFLYRKVKSPLLNPLLLSIIFIISTLTIFRIPLSSYNYGGEIISLFLSPATAILSYSIYNQIDLLKKNWIPILAGCFTGALTSMGSVFLLCRLFGLDSSLTAALLPKSVTTPIAMELSTQLGGISSITVAAVVVTGIIGAIFAPLLIRIFHIKNKVAAGIGIGSSSHALGTTKALELGEIEGAMSGIAIGVSGIITVFITMFLS